MPSKNVEKLEKRLEKLETMLESGRRGPSAMSPKGSKLTKLDIQTLNREIKKIKDELKAEYNLEGSKGNKLGYALDGEIEETDRDTTPQIGNKASAKKNNGNSNNNSKDNSKDKPKLVKRTGPSYSDDMTQDDYGLREKVRIRNKAEEENIGEAAAEANLKKGGTVRKAKPTKYGMKHGGFTKRGGMYKKGMS